MRWIHWIVLAILSGAHPQTAEAASPRIKAPADKSCKPGFVGDLIVNVNRDGRTMTLVQPFAFVDQRCINWIVPTGAVVDGASIPQAGWSLVGGPFEGKYREASVIHDWYCALRVQPWQAVHLMFYEAMRANGVEQNAADRMYQAVRRFGPQWDQITIRNSNLVMRQFRHDQSFLTRVSKFADSQIVKRVIDAVKKRAAGKNGKG